MKLFFMLISLTVGAAAVLKTMELMDAATQVVIQATDLRAH